MSDLFDAQQALQTARESRRLAEIRMEGELKELLEEIKQAAKKGDLDIHIYRRLDDYIVHRLKELGYRLEHYSDYNEESYKISW